MADYSQYNGISPAMTALLPHIPNPPPGMTIQALKAAQNSSREAEVRESMKAFSSSVTIADHSIPSRDGKTQIEARSYRPADKPADEKLPVFLFFHGGGFLMGTLNTEDATCSRIVKDLSNSGEGEAVVVVHVNYRHTPEYTYPAQWEDSEDGLEWVFANADVFGGDASRIVVGGISAGAQLSAALVQTKKREDAPSFKSLLGQVLMIPCLVDEPAREALFAAKLKDPKISSWVDNADAPILPVARVRLFSKLLLPQDYVVDTVDPRVSPGIASDDAVKGLPPATFGIAGLDPLRDEALIYAEQLAANG
jgi:acetyl esterase/lipase